MEVEVEFLEVNMCAICLSEKSQLVEVTFDETDTQCIGPVLVRHLWFRQEELSYRYVCEDCWKEVKHFHHFYMMIEKVHAEMKLSSDRDKLYSPKTEFISSASENRYTSVAPQDSETCNEQITNESETVDLEEVYIKNESSHDTSEKEDSVDNESEDEDESMEETSKPSKYQCKEKLSKIFHKPVEVIVEEDKKISQHCKLECDECKTSFPNFTQFKRHFREVHQTKGYVVCCNRKFHKRVHLVEHVTKHINPDAFKCTICNKTYCNSTGLSLHMTKHGAQDGLPHKCDQCERSFAKKFQLNTHQLQHVAEEDKKCVCTVCNKTLANKYSLQHHINRIHLRKFKFVCDICGRILNSRHTWKTHRLTHSEVLPLKKIQCPQCGSWHKNTESLLKHERTHNEHKRTQHVCPDCGKVAPTSNALRSHRVYVHQLKPSHVCSVCGKAFKKDIALREHMSQHTGKRLYKCTYCEKEFNSSANMFAHRKRTHREEWEKNITLNSQQNQYSLFFSYASMALLNVHIKLKHNAAEKFICDVCAKSFKVKAQFEKHRKEHDESYQEARLQCKICSKWMKNASSLRKHVLRHDGEGGTHECSICGKRAPNVLALQSHISFVHKKERMYQCSLCSKAFKRHFSLMEHMTTHTGEVLYQCPFCLKPFNSSANMHAHKKKMHRVEWEESKRKSDLPFCGVDNSES
ncbi:transcription factor grauzone-like [Toxorhynchites rutilus septentrionalis]|uniref:transcription factor grauzone-like n=1 Tax=Toxorhynchites rutilus septentrionalis TaxID=329112 RepID=UPI002478A6F5|nr:transcription factor grauzone-like [Toxorhynchites rutilus septentrionalis]